MVSFIENLRNFAPVFTSIALSKKQYMKRDITWQSKYDAIWTFVSENHRGPSRHHLEEKRMLNWLKYNRKILNKGVLSPEKTDLIMRLRAYIASFNRINQYM